MVPDFFWPLLLIHFIKYILYLGNFMWKETGAEFSNFKTWVKIYLLILIHQVSKNSWYYASVLHLYIFWDTDWGTLFKSSKLWHKWQKKWHPWDHFKKIFLLICFLSKKLVQCCGRSFLKANNVLPFCSSCGKY